MNPKRIWELDALRGLCILAVVAVHFVYDLVDLYGLVRWEYPVWFDLLKNWGGILFFLLSGICVTLGSRSMFRGCVVFSCGLLCTAVTFWMFRLEFMGQSNVIWFGALHCLGACMLLWTLFRKRPAWLTGIFSLAFTSLGMYWQLSGQRGNSMLLIPLGLPTLGFSSPDYFPLLPFLGFFLLGALAGTWLYPQKQSLLPHIDENILPLRFLRLCGRHSLLIYLLHQPVLMGLCMMIG